MFVVEKYIFGDFNIEGAIEWCAENCHSFEKYKLVELDAQKKIELDCWFRFDVYFADEQDASFYSLKWL